MSEYDTSDISQEKRKVLPNSFGAECPNCGQPFDVGSSGIIFPDGDGHDVRSWVRMCIGDIPKNDWFTVPPKDEGLPFVYVHKDEHLGSEE